MDVANFIAAAFVGRIEDEQTAGDALRMLRVPTGIGYERVLSVLSSGRTEDRRGAYREFVLRDVDGNVDKIRADLGHNPALLAALDTTAKPLAQAPLQLGDSSDLDVDSEAVA